MQQDSTYSKFSEKGTQPTPSQVWTQRQWDLYAEAVCTTGVNARFSAAKEWFKFIDPVAVVQAIGREVHAVQYMGYAIVYNIGAPWYNPKTRFLNECLVVRLEPGPGRLDDVVECLEFLARETGCQGITVGNALTTDDRLRRFYERRGFKLEANSLFKEI